MTHMDSLYRLALHKTKNEIEAQDLVQDTYLKAYRFFDKFSDGTDCRAWLITILRNTLINKIQNNQRKPEIVSLSEMEECGIELPLEEDPEDKIFGDSFDDEVTVAIDSLRDQYKTVVLLSDVEGLSYKEISEIVGCPIGTVMSRLHRARKLLRERLQGYAIEHGYAVQKIS